MKQIETKNLILRGFELSDAEAFHRFFADEEALRLADMLPAFTDVEETREVMERWSKNECRLAIVLMESGELAGYLAINPDSEEGREDTREIGCGLIAEYRGKGYMVEAIGAVIELLREQGIKYVWACCYKENPSSERLIRKCGFEFMQEGTYESGDGVEHQSLEFRMEL